MSVALPISRITVGEQYNALQYNNSHYKTGVIVPPEDQIEIRVHSGCTKEVSSFEATFANFDKKYTDLFAVMDLVRIWIGRGTNLPLIFFGKVEEIKADSFAMENYVTVNGRCFGEWLFRRLVTKAYLNKKGEDIVKDLMDNFVGLSHVRDSTELIENTDTTYTRSEYEDTPVFDILKHISESADKAGVIGFDFRVAPDGKFEFFPRNSKTSSVSLSEKLEVGKYRKDISRVRNKIKVYGARERKEPANGDACESLTDWIAINGTLVLDPGGPPQVGDYCVKCIATLSGVSQFYRSFEQMVIPEGCKLLIWARSGAPEFGTKKIRVRAPDGSNYFETNLTVNVGSWARNEFALGKNQEYDPNTNPNGIWTKVGLPTWFNVQGIEIYCVGSSEVAALVDGLHFFPIRFHETYEDFISQQNYGLRELVEVDEELYSDYECWLRARAICDHLKNPAEYLTLISLILDYGNMPILAGDKIHVTLPNENVDADFRILSVDYYVNEETQELEVILELGKELPLLADYLYVLRSKTSSLARYKASVR